MSVPPRRPDAGGPDDGRPDDRLPVRRDAVRLAVGTMTALPVPAPTLVDTRRAGAAMAMAPAVGLIPGAVGAAVAAVAGLAGADPLVAAVLVVSTLTLASRGLHLDGLADTADGLAASYDRARALEVMHRGDTGPSGVAAVVLVLMLQVAALAGALPRLGPVAVLVAAAAGRGVLAVVCVRGVPAARPDGLGAAVAGSVPRGVAAFVVTGTALAASLACAATAGTWRAAPAGALAVAVAVVVAALLARRAVRRLGGVTGDVLGACVEVATACALVVLGSWPAGT